MQQRILLYVEELLKRAKMLDLLLLSGKLSQRIIEHPWLDALKGNCCTMAD